MYQNDNRIQYPSIPYLINFEKKYPGTKYIFIDLAYHNSGDSVVKDIMNIIPNSELHSTTVSQFVEMNPIIKGDIVIDFSGSWNTESLCKKIKLTENINGDNLLFPMACGCDYSIYQKKNNVYYLDYHLIIDPYLDYNGNFVQYFLPNIKMTSDYDIFVVRCQKFKYKLDSYLKNTINLNQQEVWIKEDKSFIYEFFLTWISTIRWFILDNMEKKPHHISWITSSNYLQAYRQIQYFDELFQLINPSIRIELLQIINQSPDKKFNFTTIANNLEDFYQNPDDNQYLSTLPYDNFKQLEIWYLDEMIKKFKKKINING